MWLDTFQGMRRVWRHVLQSYPVTLPHRSVGAELTSLLEIWFGDFISQPRRNHCGILLLGLDVGQLEGKRRWAAVERGGGSYFAASLRSVTLLSLLYPSLKIVWLATVNIPFLVMKSGKHRWTTEIKETRARCDPSSLCCEQNNINDGNGKIAVHRSSGLLTSSARNNHGGTIFISNDVWNGLQLKAMRENKKCSTTATLQTKHSSHHSWR